MTVSGISKEDIRKAIRCGLKDTVTVHGPVDLTLSSSLEKRIMGHLKSVRGEKKGKMERRP